MGIMDFGSVRSNFSVELVRTLQHGNKLSLSYKDFLVFELQKLGELFAHFRFRESGPGKREGIENCSGFCHPTRT